MLSRTKSSENRERERERERERDRQRVSVRFCTVESRDELIGIWGRWWNDTDREI